jgi:hypothetical protein
VELVDFFAGLFSEEQGRKIGGGPEGGLKKKIVSFFVVKVFVVLHIYTHYHLNRLCLLSSFPKFPFSLAAF